MRCRDLVRKLKKAGWVLTTTNGGHIKAFPPDKTRFFILSGTPSDVRGDKNKLSEIKRAGYAV